MKRGTFGWLLIAAILTSVTVLRSAAIGAASEQAEATPYVRPAFAQTMEELRPAILAAAARHNRPEISGMTDGEFAVVIALLLYNEHFGWLEDDLPPLRALTPFYQAAQVDINRLGGNLSVWPSNLRPSVALEILRNEIPVRDGALVRPLSVAGSRINPAAYTDQRALNAAITAEITQPELAVEYLAANLERGLYRAQHEGVPVSWQTLAAWHNQGIVHPADIRANPTARDYIRRTAAYLPVARALIGGAAGTAANSRPSTRETGSSPGSPSAAAGLRSLQ